MSSEDVCLQRKVMQIPKPRIVMSALCQNVQGREHGDIPLVWAARGRPQMAAGSLSRLLRFPVTCASFDAKVATAHAPREPMHPP